ncbi:DUF3089 domain-containing protein [Sphingobium sp.]|uniref:DUF3089 domain-containing protein n=1 Tax=Sphingobium sp. TaxID=1912891 RepID=UPI0035C7014F
MLSALAVLLLTAGAPAGPDYRRAENWALLEDAAKGKGADLFYIHPTTFRSDRWNQDLADRQAREWVDASVTARQTSAFADCCRRFMPRYRQASSRAFVERDGEGQKAYDLAYEDVRAAFRAFIAHHAHGRPFLIAGHSQGALHGLRLIREEISGTPLMKRLVVAFLPGVGMPLGSLPRGLPPCAQPDSTGCIASWNSFAHDADTASYVARSVRDYGVAGRDPTLLCVNPLSFSLARPAAGFDSSKGALPGPADKNALPPLVPGAVAASCEGGVLRVTTRQDLPVERLPGGNLHMNDIAFFWADIAANSGLRVAAWRHGDGARHE